MKKQKTGFTLLELLIVVALLGLITTLAFAAISEARKRARDNKRIADLTAIRTALELYFNDNGHYPPSHCGFDCVAWSTSFTPAWDALAAELEPYLSPLPRDPVNSSCLGNWGPDATCLAYGYGNVGRHAYPHTYDLTSLFESRNHPESCLYKDWRWNFDNRPWCVSHGGGYPDRVYEASRN